MRAAQKIFVVDDDPSIRDAIAEYLASNGYCVRLAAGAEGLDALLQADRPDLIILDWMMPGEDGISICRRLQSKAIPVLMLSAMNNAVDRVIGLEVGADDYLSKPFDPRELLARVRAILRREQKLRGQRTTEIRFSGWRMLPDQRRLFAPNGNDVFLSPLEFLLLVAFAERPGRSLSREFLLQLLRGDSSDSADRTIDLTVSRLRRKLESAFPGAGKIVQTIRGEGYRFCREVSVL